MSKYRIRQLRKLGNLSQKKLCELSGVPQSTISEIESGNREPSYQHMEKIAFALGVTMEELALKVDLTKDQ